ncbi:MAG: DUF3343 domain-containing protein [Clostridia bacterium]|nr:DUF3343 domain-containing protein [Clostridia bacterium]
MRAKQLKLIVTFHTTTSAMAMERICMKKGIPGRLIPEGVKQPLTFWARIKFTGPAFPHGKADETNAVYIERVCLAGDDCGKNGF